MQDTKTSEALTGKTVVMGSNMTDINAREIRARLDHFRKLEDGWADGIQHASDWGSGYGKAPSDSGLDWLADTFTSHYPEDLPRPDLYPTPEGGVQAEWSLGKQEISLEVNLETHMSYWHRSDFTDKFCDDNDEEHHLSLDEKKNWDWFIAEIRRFTELAK